VTILRGYDVVPPAFGPLLAGLPMVVDRKGFQLHFCEGCLRYHYSRDWARCQYNKKHLYTHNYVRTKLYMKKPNDVGVEKAGKKIPSDEGFGKKYPTLLEYLSTTKWDDGTPRDASKLSIFIEDGLFKCAVNDTDLKRSLYVSGDTLEGALRAAEKALQSPEADWRVWNKGKGRK